MRWKLSAPSNPLSLLAARGTGMYDGKGAAPLAQGFQLASSMRDNAHQWYNHNRTCNPWCNDDTAYSPVTCLCRTGYPALQYNSPALLQESKGFGTAMETPPLKSNAGMASHFCCAKHAPASRSRRHTRTACILYVYACWQLGV